jgi:predicted amidophosphoribosyltransferase
VHDVREANGAKRKEASYSNRLRYRAGYRRGAAEVNMKMCERCAEQLPGDRKRERYCKKCAKAVVDELKEVGYLQQTPRNISTRTREMMEDTHETKHGGNR